MRDFTVFYTISHTRISGSSFSVPASAPAYAKLRVNSIEEIQSELEELNVFDADIFCVLNGHHDDVLGD